MIILSIFREDDELDGFLGDENAVSARTQTLAVQVSVPLSAETSLTSPQKLFFFYNKKTCILGSKYPKIIII